MISTLIDEKKTESINKETDNEIVRFKNTANTITFNYKFLPNYDSSFIDAGFTSDEILKSQTTIRNSFFYMSVFDKPNRFEQNLLHSGFYNGYKIKNTGSSINLNSNTDFLSLYIQNSFIEKITANTKTLYATFLFFNSKTGLVQLFYNQDNENLNNELKLYVPLIINKTTNKYYFNANSINLKEYSDVNYSNLINNKNTLIVNNKPQYQVGKLFNSDGTYTELE